MRKHTFTLLLTIGMSLGYTYAHAQTVTVIGHLKSSNTLPVVFKDYVAELRSDDSTLIETQKVNTAGYFSFKLRFAHDYYVGVLNTEKTVWQLIVKNRLEKGSIEYPVTVFIPPIKMQKDVYEVTVDKDGITRYLKNGLPITEITYRFETERRDTSEYIHK